MAGHSKPARTSHLSLATRHFSLKIEPVVTSKCASGRPLLTESAPQSEFRVTHSKQTTEKFLTGARTHIRIFNFSPFTSQNPAQLIHRYRGPISPEKIHCRYSTRIDPYLSRRFTRASLRSGSRSTAGTHRRNPYKIPKTVPAENSTVSLFLSRCFIRASLRFHARPAHKPVPSVALLPGSAQNVECDVTSTKQTTEDFLPGATTTSGLSRNNAALPTQNPAQLMQHRGLKIFPKNAQVRRRPPFCMRGRAPLTLFAGWANMARTS
jgi:hypothetical protein